MSNLAEVVTLYETNCRAIPDMLRQLADSIESEDAELHDMTKTVVSVQVKESGDIEIYGWGDADELRTLGLLHLAAHHLAGNMP